MTGPGGACEPRPAPVMPQPVRVLARVGVTLQDLHGQDDPGVLQVGDVEVSRGVAGQADVQHPGTHVNTLRVRTLLLYQVNTVVNTCSYSCY